MARPRRSFSGQTTIEARQDEFREDVLGRPLGTRRRQRHAGARHWSYRVPNGTQDPLSYYLLLWQLLNIDDEVELRAKPLSDWLNREAEQFMWDPVTVGRILNDMREAFEDVLGVGFGFLQAGRDSRGMFYHIHATLDAVTLALNVLDDLRSLSEHEIRVRTLGEKTDFMGSPLIECPSLRGEFKEEEEG